MILRILIKSSTIQKGIPCKFKHEQRKVYNIIGTLWDMSLFPLVFVLRCDMSYYPCVVWHVDLHCSCYCLVLQQSVQHAARPTTEAGRHCCCWGWFHSPVPLVILIDLFPPGVLHALLSWQAPGHLSVGCIFMSSCLSLFPHIELHAYTLVQDCRNPYWKE